MRRSPEDTPFERGSNWLADYERRRAVIVRMFTDPAERKRELENLLTTMRAEERACNNEHNKGGYTGPDAAT